MLKFLFSRPSLKGKIISTQLLTKEFRLKDSEICEDLLTYARVFVLRDLTAEEKTKNLITIPTTIAFEKKILVFCAKVIDALLRDKLAQSSLEDDLKQLEDV
jgi:hypothetical protein